MEKEIHDLNAVVWHAADAVGADGRPPGSAGDNLEQAVALLNGDPARLEQVFTNILGNAAKYTPSGGNITVDSHAAGGKARVRVRDDGHGIEPQDLGRIFGEFTRVVRPTNDPGGLGIGLSLVKSLRCTGARHRRSDAREGSEVEVLLPWPPSAAGRAVAGPIFEHLDRMSPHARSSVGSQMVVAAVVWRGSGRARARGSGGGSGGLAAAERGHRRGRRGGGGSSGRGGAGGGGAAGGNNGSGGGGRGDGATAARRCLAGRMSPGAIFARFRRGQRVARGRGVPGGREAAGTTFAQVMTLDPRRPSTARGR